MEQWQEWLTQFEEALESEKLQDEPNQEMIKLLNTEIEHCKAEIEALL